MKIVEYNGTQEHFEKACEFIAKLFEYSWYNQEDINFHICAKIFIEMEKSNNPFAFFVKSDDDKEYHAFVLGFNTPSSLQVEMLYIEVEQRKNTALLMLIANAINTKAKEQKKEYIDFKVSNVDLLDVFRRNNKYEYYYCMFRRKTWD